MYIELSKAKILMNSKGEWNGSKIPSVVVETRDTVEVDKWDGDSSATATTRREMRKMRVEAAKHSLEVETEAAMGKRRRQQRDGPQGPPATLLAPMVRDPPALVQQVASLEEEPGHEEWEEAAEGRDPGTPGPPPQ